MIEQTIRENGSIGGESRQARYGRTEKKTITLTSEGIAQIEAWAERHGLYFSVAIESLAMMGLQQETAETLPRMISNLLERIVNRQFNRFAKLLSLTAITAEEANWKTDVLLLQHIWREARLDPEQFVENMAVSADARVEPAATARRLRDELREEAHEAAVQRLKKPLATGDVLLRREEVQDG